MSFISYAQNFEDVMLWRALKHIERGFYVDIGANDPVVESVSKAFYDRGWRGVHVEPVAEYARLLREARPDEEVIEKAVGAETGAMTLHVIPGTGLSSLVEASALSAIALRGYEHAEVVVPVITLDELLAGYVGRDIHWLKIDVEGAEFDVLRGWNAKRDRPWIMVIEATVPNSQEECHQAWEDILLEAHYQFVYFDGLSRFYVSDEHGELASSFRLPPNYFDEFVRADLVAAMSEREENARLVSDTRQQLGEVAAQLDTARQQLTAAEKLSLERHHLLEKAATDMAQLAAENSQLMAEGARLSADYDRLTAQFDQTRSQLRKLETELTSVIKGRQDALAEMRALTAQFDQTRSQLRKLETELTSVTKERQDALAEMRALTSRLDVILDSTSWRLTAPLRAVKRMVSRH